MPILIPCHCISKITSRKKKSPQESVRFEGAVDRRSLSACQSGSTGPYDGPSVAAPSGRLRTEAKRRRHCHACLLWMRDRRGGDPNLAGYAADYRRRQRNAFHCPAHSGCQGCWWGPGRSQADLWSAGACARTQPWLELLVIRWPAILKRKLSLLEIGGPQAGRLMVSWRRRCRARRV